MLVLIEGKQNLFPMQFWGEILTLVVRWMLKLQLRDYSGISWLCASEEWATPSCLSLQRLEWDVGLNSAHKEVTFPIVWEKDLLGFLVLKSGARSASSVTAILLWFLHSKTSAPKLLPEWCCWGKFYPSFLSSAVGLKGKGTPDWV